MLFVALALVFSFSLVAANEILHRRLRLAREFARSFAFAFSAVLVLLLAGGLALVVALTLAPELAATTPFLGRRYGLSSCFTLSLAAVFFAVTAVNPGGLACARVGFATRIDTRCRRFGSRRCNCFAGSATNHCLLEIQLHGNRGWRGVEVDRVRGRALLVAVTDAVDG